jgi:hypothetical protein
LHTDSQLHKAVKHQLLQNQDSCNKRTAAAHTPACFQASTYVLCTHPLVHEAASPADPLLHPLTPKKSCICHATAATPAHSSNRLYGIEWIKLYSSDFWSTSCAAAPPKAPPAAAAAAVSLRAAAPGCSSGLLTLLLLCCML